MNRVREGEYSDEEITGRYRATLARVLATPPHPKPTRDGAANPPKKRGRPAKPKD
jgi:hypothetical protein